MNDGNMIITGIPHVSIPSTPQLETEYDEAALAATGTTSTNTTLTSMSSSFDRIPLPLEVMQMPYGLQTDPVNSSDWLVDNFSALHWGEELPDKTREGQETDDHTVNQLGQDRSREYELGFGLALNLGRESGPRIGDEMDPASGSHLAAALDQTTQCFAQRGVEQWHCQDSQLHHPFWHGSHSSQEEQMSSVEAGQGLDLSLSLSLALEQGQSANETTLVEQESIGGLQESPLQPQTDALMPSELQGPLSQLQGPLSQLQGPLQSQSYPQVQLRSQSQQPPLMESAFSVPAESSIVSAQIQLWQRQVALLNQSDLTRGQFACTRVVRKPSIACGEGQTEMSADFAQEIDYERDDKNMDEDEDACEEGIDGKEEFRKSPKHRTQQQLPLASNMTVAQKVVFVLNTVDRRATTHGFVDRKLKKFASRVGSGEHHFHRAFPKVVGLTYGAFSIASCHLALQDAAGCDTPFNNFDSHMSPSMWSSKRIRAALGDMDTSDYQAGVQGKPVYAIFADTVYGRYALLYKEALGSMGAGAFKWPVGVDIRTLTQPPRGSRVVALLDGERPWERMSIRCPHARLCCEAQSGWLDDMIRTLFFREELSKQRHPELDHNDLARFRRARVYMTASWLLEGADMERIYQKRPAKVVTLEAVEEARQQRLVWEQTGNLNHVLKRPSPSTMTTNTHLPTKRARRNSSIPISLLQREAQESVILPSTAHADGSQRKQLVSDI